MKKIYIDCSIKNAKQAAERVLAGGTCVRRRIVTKTETGDYIVDDVDSSDTERYEVFAFDEKTFLLI